MLLILKGNPPECSPPFFVIGLLLHWYFILLSVCSNSIAFSATRSSVGFDIDDDVAIEIGRLKGIAIEKSVLAHLAINPQPMGYANASTLLLQELPPWANLASHLHDSSQIENIKYFIALQNETLSLRARGIAAVPAYRRSAPKLFDERGRIAENDLSIISRQDTGLGAVLKSSAKLALQINYPNQEGQFENTIQDITKVRGLFKMNVSRSVLDRSLTKAFWTLLLFAHALKLAPEQSSLRHDLEVAYTTAAQELTDQIKKYDSTRYNFAVELVNLSGARQKYIARSAVQEVAQILLVIAGEDSFAFREFQRHGDAARLRPLPNGPLTYCIKFLAGV